MMKRCAFPRGPRTTTGLRITRETRYRLTREMKAD